MAMRRDKDRLRFDKIEQAGYSLVFIWECDFDAELKSNHEMRDYIKKLKHLGQDKLEIRDAYFGGRTNATKLFYDCKEGEKNWIYRCMFSLSVCIEVLSHAHRYT